MPTSQCTMCCATSRESPTMAHRSLSAEFLKSLCELLNQKRSGDRGSAEQCSVSDGRSGCLWSPAAVPPCFRIGNGQRSKRSLCGCFLTRPWYSSPREQLSLRHCPGMKDPPAHFLVECTVLNTYEDGSVCTAACVSRRSVIVGHGGVERGFFESASPIPPCRAADLI